MGLGALILLILGDRFLPGRPVSLFVVVAAILIMSFFPLADRGVKTVGVIPAGLPNLSWPLVRWHELDDLLGLALACFLLSYVESISVVRTFAFKHRYTISAGQELLALGAANLVAGVGQGFPVAGGMSQSAVNEKAGAQTPLALVFASVSICAVLLFLTGLMRNLPQPVLAAVVLFAVGGLVRPREIRFLYRADRGPGVSHCAGSDVGCPVCLGILKGVLLAAIFSILLLLKRTSHPRIAELKRLSSTGRFVDCSRYPDAYEVPQVLVLRVESGIFYFNAQNVSNYIAHQAENRTGIKLVVVDLSTSANVDLAGARMLEELHDHLAEAGISLKLAETHGDVRDVLQAQWLEERIEGVGQRSDVEISSKTGDYPQWVPSSD